MEKYVDRLSNKEGGGALDEGRGRRGDEGKKGTKKANLRKIKKVSCPSGLRL